MTEFNKEVDATGLKCPLPILRCKKALSELQDSQILKITATDTGAVKDFQAFCKQTGHELLQLDTTIDTFTFYIKKRILSP
jgi:tRNA 2-thiouridine synthesizing protein A